MSDGVSKSQFYMWRTLFAVAHADNVVTDEEIEFMAHILNDIDFSDAQTAILKDDIVNPKNVEEMFKGVTDQGDRVKFFDFARDLVWVDGDFGEEEQGVMIKLYQAHIKGTNLDDMVGHIPLQFEEDAQAPTYEKPELRRKKNAFTDTLYSFRRRFLSFIGGDE